MLNSLVNFMNSILNEYLHFFSLLMVGYVLVCRLLLSIYINAETRKVKLLAGIGISGLFTVGEIFFFGWIIKMVFHMEALSLGIYSAVIITIFVWNLTWLFILIMYSFMKAKRKLTKEQRTILQDL